MTLMQDIPFGEWLPDIAEFGNPGLVEALNCYPSGGSYSPFRTASRLGIFTTERVLGAEMFYTLASDAFVVGGSSTRLFSVRSGIVTETTGFNPILDVWRFERFGDIIVATSIDNDPQYLSDINIDDSWMPLPGTPPRAAQVGKVDDHLVLGDLVDNADGNNETSPYRVRWSAKNNPTLPWITDRGQLSGYRDLDRRFGRVTAIVGGRFGLVFQERAVWRMEFVGAPLGFNFILISQDRGCIAAGSAVTVGANTYFLGRDGWYVTNGADVTSIGASRINQWFDDEVSDTNVRLTHGAVNWEQRSIVWNFYSDGAETFNRQLIYNFRLDRFSWANQPIEYLVQYRTNATTLGDLGATPLSDYAGIPLGNPDWLAGDQIFAVFVSDGATGSEFATMNGPAAEASFITAEGQIEDGYRSEITGLWPIVSTANGSGIRTSVRTRDQQGGPIRTSNETVKAADGFCPHKIDGWMHSSRTIIPAGAIWDKAQGVTVRASRTGRR